MSEKSRQHYQEKAVKDADENEYKSPLNIVTEIGASEKLKSDNKDYRDSWRNHKDQTKK